MLTFYTAKGAWWSFLKYAACSNFGKEALDEDTREQMQEAIEKDYQEYQWDDIERDDYDW